jgi:hypothetical protein
MPKIADDKRADLKRVYQTVFDAFALSTAEIADTLKGINTRYARELCAVLQQHDLILLTEDGDGADAWQTDTPGTYDTHEWSDASAAFDAVFGPPPPETATSTGASGRSSLKSAATGPHPCGCGCGEVLTSRAVYRPGHDARHAGQVGREIAANYATKGFDRRELLATLGSDKLREKAERIAENATTKATKRAEPPRVHVDGIAKVGKTEVVARKWPTANGKDEQYEYLHPTKGEWIALSKTAAKTFQEG